MRKPWILVAWWLAGCDSSTLDVITDSSARPCQICGNECVLLSQDPRHCGDCGTMCKAGEACCSGVCANLDNDASNCGACGVACSANAACMARMCECPTAGSPAPMRAPMPCTMGCAGEAGAAGAASCD